MSAITPHYRNVQQLPQSQSLSIESYQREYKWETENIDELLPALKAMPFQCLESFTKREEQARRNLAATLVKLVWSPQQVQEIAA